MGRLLDRMRKQAKLDLDVQREREALEAELQDVKREEREAVAELKECIASIRDVCISPAVREYMRAHGLFKAVPVVAGDPPVYRGEAQTVKPAYTDVCATCGALPHTRRWVAEGNVYCGDCGIPANVGVKGQREIFVPALSFSWREFSKLCARRRKAEMRELREELKATEKKYRLRVLNLSKRLEALSQ